MERWLRRFVSGAPGSADSGPRELTLALYALALALPVSIAGTNIAAAVLTALTLRRLWGGETRLWRPALDASCIFLWLYLAAAVLAAAAGVNPGVSLRELNKDLHKVWMLSLLLVAFSLSPSPRAWRTLAAAFAFMALAGVLQTACGWGPATGAGGRLWARAHGFVHPVTYGEQMALALLGGLCFLARPETGGQSPAARRNTAVFLILCATALVLSQTRGALAGFAAGLAVLALADPRLRRWGLRAAAAAAAMALVLECIPSGGHSFHGLLLSSPSSPDRGRLVFWKVAFRMFLDHPWTGVGPGNYRTLFARYFHGAVENQAVWGSAHNLYLHQLAERGLLGFAALCAALGSLTIRALARVRAEPNARTLWALSVMAAFLVMNMTEVAFQNEQMTTLVLFIWAWAQANLDPPETAGATP